MGHKVSGDREQYLSVPCPHQEGKSWKVSPNLCTRERPSASYISFLKFAGGINMHEQFTRQIGISYAVHRHPRQEYVDGAFCKK